MSYFLNKCKNSPNLLTKTDQAGNVYKFLILGRGENVFFQKNDYSLFCSMDAIERVLFVESIKVWEESNKKINKVEQKILADLIKEIYEYFYEKELRLS